MKTVMQPVPSTRPTSTRPRAFSRRCLADRLCTLAVGSGLLLVAACASDPSGSAPAAGGDSATSSPGMPAYDASGGETAPGAASEPAAKPSGKSITLPKEALEGLDAFVNRRATLFADVIDVDLTRSPFLAGMSRSVNPETVEVTETHDVERGLITMVLQTRGEQAPTLTTMPVVRFGDGLELIGQDRITLRFWNVQDEARPIHFNARAVSTRGKAVFGYQDDIANATKGTSVKLSAVVRKRGDVYEFSQSVQETP